MYLQLKIWMASVLFIWSGATLAYTANFMTVPDLNGSSTSFTQTFGDFDITVSGWSDTLNDGNNGDFELETASLDRFGGGWGVQNNDEGSGSPSHSADNGGTGIWKDFDMVLVDFGTAVTLESATFNWIYSSVARTEVSFAALEDSQIDVSGGLSGSTWNSVATGAAWKTSVEGSGSTSNYQASTGGANGTGAQYWLVGAYNKEFGDIGGSDSNDGLKLASIAFSTNPDQPEVPEPATVFLGLIGALGLAHNRRKLSKN